MTASMDERLLNLLRIVVEDYIGTSEPVASGGLVERYKLQVSPATIRNWFTELDKAGLLLQPHTSGGRVPTEQGYKQYVDHFITEKPVSKRDRDKLAISATTPRNEGQRVKSVARMLAELSGLAVIVAHSEADTYYTGLSQLFAQPEFREWQRVVSLSELLDHLDDTLSALRQRSFIAPQILIGEECPFGQACSAVLGSTEEGLVGILGPIRMDYQYSSGLMRTAMDAISQV